MPTARPVLVVSSDGARGTIAGPSELDHAGEPVVPVRFDNGHKLMVPNDLLLQQDDGSYRLPITLATLEQRTTAQATRPDGSLVLPVVEEVLRVERRIEQTGRVTIHKTVSQREEVVDEPLLREEVTVERVPIGRQLDAPAEVRHEGETLIIPVMEEQLVVEKRLVLKEELHITPRRTTIQQPQTVTLRSEQVAVERDSDQPLAAEKSLGAGTDRA